MKKKITVREWIKNFNNGEYNNSDVSIQCDAGWYDWFCKDSSLKNKTIKMGNIVKKINNSSKINLDEMYVWFKNNCPLNYPLYDQFKLSNIETDDVIYCINIKCGYDEANYAVYGIENNFKNALFKCETTKELINWFNDK